MPIIQCYIDEDVLRYMQNIALQVECSVEYLAEAAIENAAIEAGFRRKSKHWTTELQEGIE